MRVLLDTAALIYVLGSPERLGKRATATLANSENVLELSSVSLVEIAIKSGLGKLKLHVGDVRQAIQDLSIRVLPYTADHAFQLFALPTHHPDPFDRQIISQALNEGLPVVTPDETFRRYQGLRVIW